MLTRKHGHPFYIDYKIMIMFLYLGQNIYYYLEECEFGATEVKW